MSTPLTNRKPPVCPSCGKRDTLPSENPKIWFCANCLEHVRLSRGWPCHSSQSGLIGDLLSAGVTVSLTYEVTPKVNPSEYTDNV